MNLINKIQPTIAILCFLITTAPLLHANPNPATEKKSTGTTKRVTPKKPFSDGDSAQLSVAIGCMNDNDPRAKQAIERYDSWVDMEDGPSGDEGNIWGIYTLPAFPMCNQNAKRVFAQKSAATPLQEAFKNYLTALQTFSTTLNEANSYYEGRDYLDDKMAKGKLLHKRILNDYSALRTAAGPLHAVVSEMEEKQEEYLIEVLEAQGKFQGIARRVVRDARAVLETISGKYGNEVDAAKYLPALDVVKASAETLEQNANQDDPLQYEERELSKHVRVFVSTAKAVGRKVKDGDDFDDDEGMAHLNDHFVTSDCSSDPDTPKCLGYAFNELVEYFNRMHFDRRG